MSHDEHRPTIGERLTGIYDPKDPDGLLTVDQALNRPDPAKYGTDEKDTLDLEEHDDGTAWDGRDITRPHS
ncbi:MAG: hypothetical protein JWM23_1019 [Microbacteriaceae bacterium]|nr:hypothetical protein [Microbacteriaceae bacterium]